MIEVLVENHLMISCFSIFIGFSISIKDSFGKENSLCSLMLVFPPAIIAYTIHYWNNPKKSSKASLSLILLGILNIITTEMLT